MPLDLSAIPDDRLLELVQQLARQFSNDSNDGPDSQNEPAGAQSGPIGSVPSIIPMNIPIGAITPQGSQIPGASIKAVDSILPSGPNAADDTEAREDEQRVNEMESENQKPFVINVFDPKEKEPEDAKDDQSNDKSDEKPDEEPDQEDIQQEFFRFLERADLDNSNKGPETQIESPPEADRPRIVIIDENGNMKEINPDTMEVMEDSKAPSSTTDTTSTPVASQSSQSASIPSVPVSTNSTNILPVPSSSTLSVPVSDSKPKILSPFGMPLLSVPSQNSSSAPPPAALQAMLPSILSSIMQSNSPAPTKPLSLPTPTPSPATPTSAVPSFMSAIPPSIMRLALQQPSALPSSTGPSIGNAPKLTIKLV